MEFSQNSLDMNKDLGLLDPKSNTIESEAAHDHSGHTVRTEEEDETEMMGHQEGEEEEVEEEEINEDEGDNQEDISCEDDVNNNEEEEEPQDNIQTLPTIDLFSLAQKRYEHRLAASQQQQQHQMLVLVSLYGAADNRECMTQQNRTLTMLQGALVNTNREEPFYVVDASDPTQYPQRDALLELSGLGPIYPQFFLVRKQKNVDTKNRETLREGATLEELYEEVEFFGDYNDLFEANERQTLRSSFLCKQPLVRKDLEDDLSVSSSHQEKQENDDVQGIEEEEEDEAAAEDAERNKEEPPPTEYETVEDDKEEEEEPERGAEGDGLLAKEEDQQQRKEEAQPEAQEEESESMRKAEKKRRANEEFAARCIIAQQQAEEEKRLTLEAMQEELQPTTEATEGEQEEKPMQLSAEEEEAKRKAERKRLANDEFVARCMRAQQEIEEEKRQEDQATTEAIESEGTPLQLSTEEEGRIEEAKRKAEKKRKANEEFAARCMRAQQQAAGEEKQRVQETTEEEIQPTPEMADAAECTQPEDQLQQLSEHRKEVREDVECEQENNPMDSFTDYAAPVVVQSIEGASPAPIVELEATMEEDANFDQGPIEEFDTDQSAREKTKEIGKETGNVSGEEMVALCVEEVQSEAETREAELFSIERELGEDMVGLSVEDAPLAQQECEEAQGTKVLVTAPEIKEEMAALCIEEKPKKQEVAGVVSESKGGEVVVPTAAEAASAVEVASNEDTRLPRTPEGSPKAEAAPEPIPAEPKPKQKRRSTKKVKKLKENAMCELPDWVETWMFLPENPVVRYASSATRTTFPDKRVEITTEVTLVLRHGEAKTQRNTTVIDP